MATNFQPLNVWSGWTKEVRAHWLPITKLRLPSNSSRAAFANALSFRSSSKIYALALVIAMSCLGYIFTRYPRRHSRRSSMASDDSLEKPAAQVEIRPGLEDAKNSRWNRLKRLASRGEKSESNDPGLLRKHTSYNSYATSFATYPKIRTFFCPHPHIEKFPTEPSPLPLLVFVHGLGGSVSQFHPLLKSLTNIAPCFGIDFPGCGLSSFEPKTWLPYSVEALVELLAVAIDARRDKERNQRVVLIGHSLGAAISASLASSTSPLALELRKHIIGVVAISPPAGPPSQKDAVMLRRLLHVPTLIFDLWRKWDGRRGIDSASISRFVGEGAHIETRKLQLRFNRQSRTPVFRRIAWGILPKSYAGGKPVGGIPGKEVWEGVDVPVLLIGGESDNVTKPEEIDKILHYFGDELAEDPNLTLDLPSTCPQEKQSRKSSMSSEPRVSTSDKRLIKTFIFPSPATHALLYDQNTYRTLSGLIQTFLPTYIDPRLSLGWQLQCLTTSGKWDVKNLQKWKAVQPVSTPIGNTFVAMKTLRELDEDHNPTEFSKKWKGKIYAVIDISHESPVYDPTQLEAGGIRYVKFPTVSKIPPTTDEVRDFVSLVNRLQGEIDAMLASSEAEAEKDATRPVIGVHCHYGYNRTGFFLASYLVEEKGYEVQRAIEEFEKNRPPGIRHRHFIDTLYLRYYPGLQTHTTI